MPQDPPRQTIDTRPKLPVTAGPAGAALPVAAPVPTLDHYGKTAVPVAQPRGPKPQPVPLLDDSQKLQVERGLAQTLGIPAGNLAVPLTHKDGSGPVFRDNDHKTYITGKIRPEAERGEVGLGMDFKAPYPLTAGAKGIDYQLSGLQVNSVRDKDLIDYVAKSGGMSARSLDFAGRTPSGQTLFILDRRSMEDEPSGRRTKGKQIELTGIIAIRDGAELDLKNFRENTVKLESVDPKSKAVFEKAIKALPQSERAGLTFETMQFSDDRKNTHRLDLMFKGGKPTEGTRHLVTMTWNGQELKTVVPPRL